MHAAGSCALLCEQTTWGYKEFEMNAYNTTWDLMLNRPYGDGGGESSCRVDKPPCFDMQPPLVSAVKLNGRINKPLKGPDGGWSVEVALPIASLMAHNAAADQRPAAGTFWRINFSRVQWALKALPDGSGYVKAPSCQSCAHPGTAAEDNWVWSPQGVVAMHQPETWAVVQFAEAGVPLAEYDEWPARALAKTLYDAEHAYSSASVRSGTPRFTADLGLLDRYATPPGVLRACASRPRVELSANGTAFAASLASILGPPERRAQVTNLRYTTVTSRSPRRLAPQRQRSSRSSMRSS